MKRTFLVSTFVVLAAASRANTFGNISMTHHAGVIFLLEALIYTDTDQRTLTSLPDVSKILSQNRRNRAEGTVTVQSIPGGIGVTFSHLLKAAVEPNNEDGVIASYRASQNVTISKATKFRFRSNYSYQTDSPMENHSSVFFVWNNTLGKQAYLGSNDPFAKQGSRDDTVILSPGQYSFNWDVEHQLPNTDPTTTTTMSANGSWSYQVVPEPFSLLALAAGVVSLSNRRRCR
jgi:hypothetical protein